MPARGRLALLVFAGLVACRPPAPPAAAPGEAPGAPTEPPAQAAPVAPKASLAPAAAGAESPAVRAYWDAQRLIIAEQDIAAGISRLEQAVALDPGFAEAWYQLGTARMTAAAAVRKVDTADAVKRFRAGIADCRRALDLAQRGSLRVWDAFELGDAVAELRETLTAAGDDARLADDAAALAALDRWAETKDFADVTEPAAAEKDEKP